MSFARCVDCGHGAPRSGFDKQDLGVDEGGVYDRCPAPKCGSLNVDVYSDTGIEVQRQIEQVEAMIRGDEFA